MEEVLKPFAWVSLPPSDPGGIGRYTASLLPLLKQWVFYHSPTQPLPSGVTPIYHLGNHPSHQPVGALCQKKPGILCFHDLPPFEALPDHTFKGFWHPSLANLLPWEKQFFPQALAGVVHSQWAKEKLENLGFPSPIYQVPMGCDLPERLPDKNPTFSVGMFGYFGENRWISQVEAICHTLRIPLYLAGKLPPSYTPKSPVVRLLGWLSEEELTRWLGELPLLINLRYPHWGETSLSTLQGLAHGTPSVLFPIGSYGEIPEEAAYFVPLEGWEKALSLCLRTLKLYPKRAVQKGRAGREWIEKSHTWKHCQEGWERVMKAFPLKEKKERPTPFLPTVCFVFQGTWHQEGSHLIVRNGPHPVRALQVVLPYGRFTLPLRLKPEEKVVVYLPTDTPIQKIFPL